MSQIDKSGDKIPCQPNLFVFPARGLFDNAKDVAAPVDMLNGDPDASQRSMMRAFIGRSFPAFWFFDGNDTLRMHIRDALIPRISIDLKLRRERRTSLFEQGEIMGTPQPTGDGHNL